jgi:hypothetical protein
MMHPELKSHIPAKLDKARIIPWRGILPLGENDQNWLTGKLLLLGAITNGHAPFTIEHGAMPVGYCTLRGLLFMMHPELKNHIPAKLDKARIIP